MEYSEVKALLNAGFTADEIREMWKPETNNPQFPQLNQQDENPNVPESMPENNSETSAQSGTDQPDSGTDQISAGRNIPNIPDFEKLNENISKLIKTIQLSNLHNNSIQSTDADINTKVDNIMASLIRPEHEKGD